MGREKGRILRLGGMDNPVVKDFETGYPYIPGSSLKGKIRSLLETKYFGDDNKRTLIEFLFGAPAEKSKEKEIDYTVILVRDLFVNDKTKEKILKLKEEGKNITEEKMEVSLKKLPPNPRSLERVPRGYEFEGEIVFRFFNQKAKEKEQELINLFKEGVELLNEDYLGGSGSRGYGRVKVELMS